MRRRSSSGSDRMDPFGNRHGYEWAEAEECGSAAVPGLPSDTGPCASGRTRGRVGVSATSAGPASRHDANHHGYSASVEEEAADRLAVVLQQLHNGGERVDGVDPPPAAQEGSSQSPPPQQQRGAASAHSSHAATSNRRGGKRRSGVPDIAGRRRIPPAPPRQLFLVGADADDPYAALLNGGQHNNLSNPSSHPQRGTPPPPVHASHSGAQHSAGAGGNGPGGGKSGDDLAESPSVFYVSPTGPRPPQRRSSPATTPRGDGVGSGSDKALGGGPPSTPRERGAATAPAKSAKHSHAHKALSRHFSRRFHEPIELQVETLTAFVVRTIFLLWYLLLIACLVVEVIPQAQWSIVNICGTQFPTNLRHMDRWDSPCSAQAPSAEGPAGTVDITWTGTGLGFLDDNLKLYRRVAMSLPRSDVQAASTVRYHLQARVETSQTAGDGGGGATAGFAHASTYPVEVTCHRKRHRCEVFRLPEEMVLRRPGEDRNGPVLVTLVGVPAELAAAQSAYDSAVGIAYQKRAYTLGSLIWRYVFLLLSFIHLIRFVGSQRFTSSLYEQHWVIILQIALFWYLNPIYAVHMVTQPLPTILAFIELRIPTYFLAITIAFMFSVMTASMSWKQRGARANQEKKGGKKKKRKDTSANTTGASSSDNNNNSNNSHSSDDDDDGSSLSDGSEGAGGGAACRACGDAAATDTPPASPLLLRSRRAQRILDYIFTSPNVYDPPAWTKMLAILYIIAIVVLDVVDAAIEPASWSSGANSGTHFRGMYWAVIALLVLGGAVCLGLLLYVRNYLGDKPYLESRPQQLACRVFILVFLFTVIYYVIHCLVFFLLYNNDFPATASRTPFVQLPAVMVACGFTNIMTLVYTARSREGGVPIHPRDQRWKFMVWPDTWYRWLARHGGSQYIFYTEEEENRFYKIQFEFRRRQHMARLKRKGKGRDPAAGALTEADGENDEDWETWLSADTVSRHELVLGQRGGNVDIDDDGGDEYCTDANTLRERSVNVDEGGGGEGQGQGQGTALSRAPADYQTPNPSTAVGLDVKTQQQQRSNTPLQPPPQPRRRSHHADPASAVVTANSSMAHPLDSTGFSSLHPRRRHDQEEAMRRLYGRKVMNMDHFSTYYLPEGAGGRGARHDGLAGDSRADSYRVEGPARRLSRLREGGSVLGASSRQQSPLIRRSRSLDDGTFGSSTAAQQRRWRQQKGGGDDGAFDRAHAASVVFERPSQPLGAAAAGRSRSSPAGRPLVGAFHSRTASAASGNAYTLERAHRHAAGAPPLHLTPNVTNTSLVHNGDGDSDGDSDAASLPQLRVYEQFLPDSQIDGGGGGGGEGGGGSGAGSWLLHNLTRARDRLGGWVGAAERNLLERPVRKLDALEEVVFDAAYRPFQSSAYLPFFNLETAVDCYNMSWEAYGVEESAGDAHIDTGIKVAPENMPRAAAHGVTKLLCGCCPASASESESDDEDDSAILEGRGEGEMNEQNEQAPPAPTSTAAAAAAEADAAEPAGESDGDDVVSVPVDDAPSSPLPPAAAALPRGDDDDNNRDNGSSNVNSNGNSARAGATADSPTQQQQLATEDGLLPINVGRYGYELLFVKEIRDVQVLIVKMSTDAPEHAGKAPRLVVSFRGTANISNAKYDANMHRVVWSEMEKPLPGEGDDDDDNATVWDGASTVASTVNRAYLGCASCCQSVVRRTRWRPTCHAGFLAIWKAMRRTVLAKLIQFIRATPETVYRVFTTGHSLGGALAALCAYSAHRALQRINYPIPDITVYTFGQPHLGNRTFRQIYDKAVPRTFRIMNESDVVVTFSMFGGYHVGIGVNVDRYGNYIVKPTDMEKIFAPTKGRGMAIMNHLMTNYGISMNAIAERTTCPARGLKCYLTADPEKIKREEEKDEALRRQAEEREL